MAVMTDARERAIRELTKHCGDGRLTLDELEDRIDEVQRATTDDEIQHALRELPLPRPESEPVVAERPRDDLGIIDAAPASAGAAPSVRLPASDAAERAREHRSQYEKSLGTACCIGGFVLLFNGMFWLALLCWFVLPGLILRHRAS
jgi:hypothetical protein